MPARQEYPGRLSQLLLLAAAMAAGGYVRTALSPLQEAMRLALSLTDNQMAVLQGPIIGVPVTLAAIPLGLLVDRCSRIRLLGALMAASVLGTLFTAFVSDFSLLLVARGIAGIAGVSVIPVVFSLLADLYPAAQRGRVTTVIVIGQVAGNAAAFSLGGLLLAMAGSTPDGWRFAMLWMVAPLVSIALLTLALREPPRTGLAIGNPSMRQIWSELRHYRAVISVLVVGVVLVETAVGAMLIWGAPMLSRNFDLPPDDVGSIMAVGMLVSGILGPLLGGGLADLGHRRGGPRRTTAVLCWLSLLSVPPGMFAFVPGVAIASVLLVTAMTMMLAIAVMGMTLFTIVIPNELRGLCMSVLMAAILFFALAVAPLAVSLLSGAIGGAAMIGVSLSIICVTTGFGAALTFALGRRYLPKAVESTSGKPSG
jgi:predicted MFS family arabinose efflux permease